MVSRFHVRVLNFLCKLSKAADLKKYKKGSVANNFIFSTSVYSRGLNIGPGDFHIHIKTKSSDDVSMFRNVQVVIALEKTGIYMCGKQRD